MEDPVKNPAEESEDPSYQAVTDPEPPAAVERVIEKKGGFGAALLGGVIAAGLGFVAGRGEILDPYLPDALKSNNNSEAITAVGLAQSELSDALAAVQARIDGLNLPDLGPVTEDLTMLSEQVAPLADGLSDALVRLEAIEGQIAPLTTRLGDLEKRPITEGVSDLAIDAYEAELARLQDSLATQREEVENMVAEAKALDAASAAAALAASAQSAVARLKVGLDAGDAIDAGLEELRGLGVAIPDALTEAAGGVPTLQALIADYAPAARAALAEARAEAKGSGGVLAYVQRQLGARSVTPREGDDPDAILSRVEAAVTSGQLEQALAELAALPDSARAALADWEAAATARLTAIRAADALAQSLNSN